jgi:hypothetical protein
MLTSTLRSANAAPLSRLERGIASLLDTFKLPQVREFCQEP